MHGHKNKIFLYIYVVRANSVNRTSSLRKIENICNKTERNMLPVTVDKGMKMVNIDRSRYTEYVNPFSVQNIILTVTDCQNIYLMFVLAGIC